MPAPAPIITSIATTTTRGLHRRCGRDGARSTTAGRPPRGSCGGALSSTSGSRLCVFCSDIRRLVQAPRGPIRLTGDLDEIAVAKPLAVVENRNNLRRNPEQCYLLQRSRRVRRDLRKLPEHQLTHLVHLLWVSDTLRPATDRQTANFAPVSVRQVDCERNLAAAGEILRFLRCRGAAKI